MSISASELNPRIRKHPVLGRIYMAVALIGLLIEWIGLLVFGAIYKSGSAALESAIEEGHYHLRTTVRDGVDIITFTVRHIFSRWSDEDTGESDSKSDGLALAASVIAGLRDKANT